jgi:hypothetical protein
MRPPEADCHAPRLIAGILDSRAQATDLVPHLAV